MFDILTNDCLDDLLNKLSIQSLCKISCINPDLSKKISQNKYWYKYYLDYNDNKKYNVKHNLKKKVISLYLKKIKKMPCVQYGDIDNLTILRLESLVRGYVYQINSIKTRQYNNKILGEISALK